MTRALASVLVLLLLAGPAAAQQQGTNAIRTLPKGSTGAGFPTSSSVDANTQALDVFIRGGAGSGGTAQTDESTYTEGAGTFTPAGCVLNDTITSDPTEDQAFAARCTPKRAIHVNLRDASGNEVSVGGGTQYDEDTASAAAEKLTMAGVVRRDTASSLVDLDGDRTELIVDGSGRLHVNPNFPTTASTNAVSVRCVNTAGSAFEACGGAGGAGGTSSTDQAGFTAGTTAGTPSMGARDDTTPSTLAEDTVGILRATTNRALHTNLRAADGTEVGTASAPVRVDPTGTTTQPVSGTVTANQGGAWSVTANAGTNLNTSALALDATLTNRLPSGSTPADNESNAITASRLPVYTYIFDGTTWDRWTGAISGTVTANAGTGTFTVGQATAANLKAQVQGEAASGAAKAGNPVQVGGVFNTTQPTVTTGQAVELQATARGALIVATGVETPTFNVGTFPDNEPFNLNQVGGTAVVSGGLAGSLGIGGLAAHDAAVAGNPVLLGARSNENEPTDVSADGEAVHLWATRKGALIVYQNFPPNVAATGTHGPNTSTLTTTSDVALVAAPGASLSVYVASVDCSNTSATLTRVDLKDGTTIRAAFAVAASGGGFVREFNPPWKITANTAVNAALGTAVTDVRCNTHFYVAP